MGIDRREKKRVITLASNQHLRRREVEYSRGGSCCAQPVSLVSYALVCYGITARGRTHDFHCNMTLCTDIGLEFLSKEFEQASGLDRDYEFSEGVDMGPS